MAFCGFNGKAALIASMDFRTIMAEMDIRALEAMAILAFIACMTLMGLMTLIAMMTNRIQRIKIAYPT